MKKVTPDRGMPRGFFKEKHRPKGGGGGEFREVMRGKMIQSLVGQRTGLWLLLFYMTF